MEGEITVRREGSFISFTREVNGKQLVTPCRDIRGAMTWPTLISPAYFCVFAQETERTARGKPPLVLLGEGESALPQELFRQLIEDARRLSCREFYVDFEKQNREVMALFNDICRYGRVSHIQLTRARLTQNFALGLGLVREWSRDAAVEIPEGTVLRAQLSAMSSDDLAQKPEEKFYAVNSLRLLIGSLEKNPWEAPVFSTGQGRDKVDWRAWT